MTFTEYQVQARKFQNTDLSLNERTEHALWGLASETGEVCSLFQKLHQCHTMSYTDLREEMGDVLWMLSELCDVYGFSLGAIAEGNIRKLSERYPNGFEADRSVHRKR